MAKDNITLLQEISSQLRKLNQDNVREQLANREFRDRQASEQAGGLEASQDPQFLDAGEDFKRRLKAGIAGQKAGEAVTESGKRAKRSNKEAKEAAKYKKKVSVKVADKHVGLSTLANLINNQNLILIDQANFWKGLLENDKKQFKIEQENRLNDKRAAIEDKREMKKLNVIDQAQPMLALPDPNSALPKKKSLLGSLAKAFMLYKALPFLLGGAVIALTTGAIKDFISGFKADGLEGAIGKMLGGSGEGMWNSIKQSFKVGGLGATIGGAIGFLFGGVGAIPGAIIGGLVGMAIGAIAGYIGGDKITAGLKDSTAAVANAFAHVDGFFLKITRIISDFIFTPGTEARSGNHGAVQAKLFNGFISWDPGNFSITAAWDQAMGKIKHFFSEVGNAIYNPTNNTFFGGTSLEWTAPDWFDGVERGVMKVWNGIRDFGQSIKSAVIRLLPDWLTDRLGMTVNGQIPGEFRTHEGRHPPTPNPLVAQVAAMGESYIGLGSEPMDFFRSEVVDRFANTGLLSGEIQKILADEAETKRLDDLGPLRRGGIGAIRARLALAAKEQNMNNYLDGKQRSEKPFVNHNHTDLSNGKGAVTVIQHLYSDGTPTKATMTIHDHMDLNYGMSYSGY